MQNSQDFKREVAQLQRKQPGLTYDVDSGFLSGLLTVGGGDKYQVDINVNPFPQHFPVVWETGGRIPRKLDRHIFTQKGNCCFTTSAKEQILLKTKIKSLPNFIDLIVVPYFQNNSYFELNKTYLYGEYSHSHGVLESYFDILGVNEKHTVIDLLLRRVLSLKFSTSTLCYCNSGKLYYNCHNRCFENLFLVNINTIVWDVKRILLLK